jgi:spore coat protein CotH
MTHRRLLVLAAAALMLTARPQAQALTASDLFNDQVLQEIRLQFNSRDLAQLRANYLTNTFYVADLTWRNVKVRNVAVRSRGTGSRNPIKMGLLVDMSRYTAGQTFLGMTQLVLDNEWQDASMMREMLAMSIHRRMGQVAPREAFARLYINSVYQGLYAVVEAITPGFAQRTLGESTGYLYEYHYIRSWNFENLGDDLIGTYKPMFEPQNHRLESSITLWDPIRALLLEVNGPDDAVWRERVEARIDVGQFLRHVAIQGVIAENDGILGYAGMNNFFVYRFAGTNRHRLIAWDEDFAFTFPDSSIFRRGEVENVLFTRAYQYPDLRTLFLDTAEACAVLIGQDNWMSIEVARLAALIGPAVAEDTRKQFSTDAFTAQVEFLATFAAQRTAQVVAEVARSR